MADATEKKVLDQLKELKECLSDEKAPIAKRTRSVFKLRQIGGKSAIDILALGLKSSSVLLSHEVAYCLGQMQDPYAIPMLSAALEDEKNDVILRHEAAEALGAIGSKESLKLLERYSNHKAREISETCQLAVARINGIHKKKKKKKKKKGPKSSKGETEKEVKEVKTAEEGEEVDDDEPIFHSVDPAPPLKEKLSTEELQKILCDTTLPLYRRYRAMFTLRNQNTEASALALAASLTDKEESALFKHEVAYVLGQMQNPAATKALQKLLENDKEHEMVRHEAAEALGSVGGVEDLLKKYQKDSRRIVKESCDVALDIQEYWQSEEQLE